MQKAQWKILIVDENPAERGAIRALLATGSDRPYEFSEAETGTAAVQLCDGADCMILGCSLSDPDALAVLAALRSGQDTARCPVLVLTDAMGRERASALLRGGAMFCLGRSWMNAESLTHCVENAVERYALHRRTALHLKVSQLLTENAESSEVLLRLLQLIVPSLGWALGAVWLPDAAGEAITCHASWHRDRPGLKRAAASLSEPTAGGWEGLYRQAAGSGTLPIWISDIARDGWGPRAESATAAGLRSALAFPLLVEQRCLGWIELFQIEPQAPDDELLLLVNGLGAEIGQFVERKRAESALRESEERLRILSDNLPDSVVYQYAREPDGRQRFLYVSAGIERLCGLRPDELLRDPGCMFSLIPPEDAARVLMAGEESARTLADFEAEFPLRRPDGAIRWMRVRSRPRLQSGGRVLWDGVQTDVTRWKLAEQRVRDRETHMRLALDAAQAVAFDWDIVRDRVQRLHSSEEALPQTDGFSETFEDVVAVVHKDDRVRFRQTIQDALATKEATYQSQHRIQRKSGEVRWLDEWGRFEYDADGRPLQLIGIAIDVTARKQAEEDLRASEAALRDQELRCRLVVEAANDTLWDWNLLTDRVDWSERLRSVFGHDPQSIDPSIAFWKEHIHPADRERVLSSIESFAQSTEESWRAEYRFRRSDGSYAPVYDRCRVVRDAHGRPVRMVGSLLDLSDQKRAEQEANEREHRLRLAMEASATGMWDWDVVTGSVSWSSECYGILGMRQGEFDGTAAGFDRLLHPDDRARVWAAVEAAAREQAKYALEFRIVRPSGEIRWVANLGRAVYDEQGQPQRMIGTITDITERKRAEEALRDADRRKDEFLATLSHELRNPLAPLRNAIELLRLGGPKDPVTVKVYDMIERQVTQMVRLVDDLLDVSRVSQGKVQLQKVPLDLIAVAQQATEMILPLINARRHELSVQLPTEPVPVKGDPARLAQVVSNLLNNAAKYTDRGGRIALTLERGMRGAMPVAVIRVRDSGRGLDPVALGSLFNLFYQVERNLDRAEGGLGIGLSLVKSLVQLHDGEVEAHSSGLGQGSEFTVRLPLLLQQP